MAHIHMKLEKQSISNLCFGTSPMWFRKTNTCAFPGAFLVALMALSIWPNSLLGQDEDVLERAIELVESVQELEKELPFDQLKERADVVIIASLIQSKEVDVDFTKFPDVAKSKNIVASVSTFQITTILNGTFDGDRIEVVHFNRKQPYLSLGELRYASFYTEIELPTFLYVTGEGAPSAKNLTIIGVKKVKPIYLMFLKRRDDDKYEPASGHRFARDSFRILNSFPGMYLGY